MPSKKTLSMYYALKAIAKKKGNRKVYEHFDKKIKQAERAKK